MGCAITRIVKFLRRGEKGNSLITAVTELRRYTQAQWQGYGKVGTKINWTGINNASDMKIGDTIVINGVVTDKENISVSLYGTIVAINGTSVEERATALIMGGERGIPGAPGAPGEHGDRGPALRGPQDFSSLPTDYQFYQGADEEPYVDIVYYDGNYYKCVWTHKKRSDDISSSGLSGKYWVLSDKVEMIATKILLASYALIKNLGVEAIEMEDGSGNIVFRAKDGNVTCNSGTFNNIKVTANSEFSGTMKAVSGSFKSLDCVDDSGKVVGNITFGSDGRMWFDGDMYSQGYRYDKQRNNRFYASDILCRGMFGHREKITAVVKGSYMYVYSKGADQSGTYISLKTGKTSDNKTFYYIPLYSPSDADDLSGLPIDVVVFNTSLDYYYAFSGMNNGKEWRVINGNDKQTVHFCDIVGWHSLGGGASVNCIYVNPEWLNPVPGASGIGRGVFWNGETDLNW